MNNFPKRGEVYWVCLDPTMGVEVNKTRPAVILSNDIANKISKRVIVAPISSSIERIYAFEVKIVLPKNSSKVMIDQIRSIDKMRLAGKIATLTIAELQEIEKALKLVLAIS